MGRSNREIPEIMRKILGITLIIIFSFNIASCGQISRKSKQAKDTFLSSDSAKAEEAIEQEVSTFLLTGYTTGGAKEWEVKGDSAKIFAATDEVELDNMTASFWGDDNRNMKLSSDIGTFDRVSRNAHFEKDVIVTDETGTKLQTEYLDWYPQGEEKSNSQLIKTNAYVRIERENFKAEGIGLCSKHELSEVQLNEKVKVSMGGPQPVVITCSGPLELDYKSSIAHFNKNVKVSSQHGELFADKMDVFINKEEKSINKIVCTGNVKIKQGDNTTFSRKAVYFAKEGRVVLLGSPKLVIYPGEMEDGSIFNKSSK